MAPPIVPEQETLQEEEIQPQERQQTCWERQLDDRDHVFEILNFSDEAVEVMNNQSINNITCFITTKRNIYDGLASQFRNAWTLTATEQVVL